MRQPRRKCFDMTLSGFFSRVVSGRRRLPLIAMMLLAASAVPVKNQADCLIYCPCEIFSRGTNTYIASSGAIPSNITFAWSLSNITASAVFLTGTNSASIQILSATNGAFALQCFISDGESSESCLTNITVDAPAQSTLLTNQAV